MLQPHEDHLFLWFEQHKIKMLPKLISLTPSVTSDILLRFKYNYDKLLQQKDMTVTVASAHGWAVKR